MRGKEKLFLTNLPTFFFAWSIEMEKNLFKNSLISKFNKVLRICNFFSVAAATNEERRFFSFHEQGISIYEPSACRLYHQIRSTDIIPGTQVAFLEEKKTIFFSLVIKFSLWKMIFFLKQFLNIEWRMFFW